MLDDGFFTTELVNLFFYLFFFLLFVVVGRNRMTLHIIDFIEFYLALTKLNIYLCKLLEANYI